MTKVHFYLLLVLLIGCVLPQGQVPAVSPPLSTCKQPPATLDLSHASNAELATYGLPPRPEKPQELSLWLDALKHARFHTCSATPSSGSAHIPQIAMATCPASGSTCITGNWAGLVARNYHFTDAAGQWTLTCPHNAYGNSIASVWVGVGGDGILSSEPLVQAGIDQKVYVPNGATYYRAWVETYWEGRGDWQRSVVFAHGLACGQQVYVYVSSDDSEDENYYYLLNEATNEYITFDSSGMGWPTLSYLSSTAETAQWIVEGHSPLALQDFGAITFTGIYALDNLGNIWIPGMPYYLVMMSNGRTDLAFAWNLGYQHVTVSWLNPGV